MSIVRIVMWSGPRNISSALMRSFENRNDTWVFDEPFYGSFLKASGAPHPGHQAIIDSMECDSNSVIEMLTKDIKDSFSINYQKHMTHHLLCTASREWLSDLKNCFLIRDPVRVISSYKKIRANFNFEDLGMRQQLDLFNLCADQFGEVPPVIDAEHCLEDPETVLKNLCTRLDIDFSMQMLEWPLGPRASDGVWAKYWYQDLYETSSFSLNRHRATPKIEEGYSGVLRKPREIYAELLKYVL